MIALPVRVMLRCRDQAIVGGCITVGKTTAPERMLVGEQMRGGFDMWFAPSGKWRESGEPHPLDIVGCVNPDGSLRPLTKEFGK